MGQFTGMGAMLGPWGLAGGAALDVGAGLLAGKGRKRAKKAMAEQRAGMLSNVDLAGSTARQDLAESFGEAQSGLANRMAERGLTGSTAFDAALNSNLGNRQRATSRINEGVAREKNAILGQFPVEQGDGGAGILSGLSGVLGQAVNLGAAQDSAQRDRDAAAASDDKWLRMLQGRPGGPGGGIGMDDAVTKAQVQGAETRTRLGGGGAWWDNWFRNFRGQ